MRKLIKVKLCIETEFVGENINSNVDLTKTARDLFLANKDEIINQSIECGDYTIEATGIVNESDLPDGWDVNCFPWSFTIHRKSKIKDLLNK